MKWQEIGKIKGKDGTNGSDAQPIDIQGIVTEVVARIPKPKDGKDAEPIHPDTVALMVLTEVNKAIAALPKAQDGKDGLPGRDALAVEILPAIDHAKEYPRGTWAKHAGGLWLARGTGAGMSAWECIVDGIDHIGFAEAGDLRHFKLTMRTASGKSLELPFSAPAMIYRGVWREGEYERGDTVTWNGCIHHCNAEKTTAKPGASDDWQLAVKHGRDGRDGKDGIGKEGRPGRDLTPPKFLGEGAG